MSNVLKAVLVGDSGVGKSSLYQRLEYNVFSASQMPTVGGSFAKIQVPTASGQAEIGLWDTAGQERFRTIVPLYFQRAALVLIVFSIDSRESFESVPAWHEMARAHAPPDVRYFLVGNKSDIEERAVELNVAQARCEQLEMAVYLETSAATGAGCEALIVELGRFVAARSGEAQEPVGAQALAKDGGPAADPRGPAPRDCC